MPVRAAVGDEVLGTAASADALNRAFFEVTMDAEDLSATRGACADPYFMDVVALGALSHRVRHEIFGALAH